MKSAFFRFNLLFCLILLSMLSLSLSLFLAVFLILIHFFSYVFDVVGLLLLSYSKPTERKSFIRRAMLHVQDIEAHDRE